MSMQGHPRNIFNMFVKIFVGEDWQVLQAIRPSTLLSLPLKFLKFSYSFEQIALCTPNNNLLCEDSMLLVLELSLKINKYVLWFQLG